MTELRFDLREVSRLLAHAKSAPESHTLYGEVTGAGLWWIKDDGTYIMSNGKPNFRGSDERNVVVYAEGYESGCDWDDLRDACGGDDFCEFLGDDVCEMVARCDGAEGHLVIIPDGDTMTIEVRPLASAQRR